MTDTHQDYDDTEDDDENVEPIGSCDECGANVYAEDGWTVRGEMLCDQCASYRLLNNTESNP